MNLNSSILALEHPLISIFRFKTVFKNRLCLKYLFTSDIVFDIMLKLEKHCDL